MQNQNKSIFSINCSHTGKDMMDWLVNGWVLLVAILHLWFLILEMFLWDKPIGLKIFRHTTEQAANTKVLAANQGLYNGCLAAGLLWSFFIAPPFHTQVQIFFLISILIAGIYGGISANKKIFYIQGLPAAIGLALLFLS